MPEAGLILLVEDDPEYALLVQIALEHASVRNPVRAVADGMEAVRYLKGEGRFADRSAYPLPWVVVLDLKMPRLGGLELLRWIRERPEFAEVRVAVLTGSESPEEHRRAMEMGADWCQVKPFGFDDLISTLKDLRAACRRSGHVQLPRAA